jgi:hypothetical protein
MKLLLPLVAVTFFAVSFSKIFADEDCCASAAPTVSSTSTESAPTARHAGIDVGGCYGKPEPQPAPAGAPTTPAPVGHPLKGVVVSVLADKSALLVKHEEIPGVMKAMTMLLKVDADTLKSPAATKDATITGLLVRKADGWWLETVVVVPAK